MPFEQEHLAEECICCGKEAKQMVYWEKRINTFLIGDKRTLGCIIKCNPKVLFSSIQYFMYFLDGRMLFLFYVLRRINSNIPIRNVESPIKIDIG